mmetsp:Transcript_34116/g.52398  ORF Transcript_34116/g.52398 Transcript_34116/m.52398 type:complete len:96 (-) Transcript_34116:20-307(-)
MEVETNDIHGPANFICRFLNNRILNFSLTPDFVRDWISQGCKGPVIGQSHDPKEVFRVVIERDETSGNGKNSDHYKPTDGNPNPSTNSTDEVFVA